MDDLFLETVSACALNRLFGFEPAVANSLIQTFGSCSAVFSAQKGRVDDALGPYSKYRGLVNRGEQDRSARELEDLEKRSGVIFIPCTSSDFPPNLLDVPDHPAGLYFKGRSSPAEVFAPARRFVSVVGTRDISLYGTQWCRNIVRSLSYTPDRPTIVSGLALGVDGVSHRSALENSLPTIAVMPTGPDEVYPRSHRQLASDIASTPLCALVTDFPPATPPVAVNFLRRNRIIAALGESTLLIESKLKGGGTMTCRLASGYGRDVYVLPGRIDDERSAGCNLLVKEKLAEPIVSVASLAASLNYERITRSPISGLDPMGMLDRLFPGRGASDKMNMAGIIETVSMHRGISIDEICSALSRSYADVSVDVRLLENAGVLAVDLCQRCALLSLQ